MTNYQVDFSYTVPEWSDVTLEAANAEEARTKATEIINELYPEAVDIEIDNVLELTNAS